LSNDLHEGCQQYQLRELLKTWPQLHHLYQNETSISLIAQMWAPILSYLLQLDSITRHLSASSPLDQKRRPCFPASPSSARATSLTRQNHVYSTQNLQYPLFQNAQSKQVHPSAPQLKWKRTSQTTTSAHTESSSPLNPSSSELPISPCAPCPHTSRALPTSPTPPAHPLPILHSKGAYAWVQRKKRACAMQPA